MKKQMILVLILSSISLSLFAKGNEAILEASRITISPFAATALLTGYGSISVTASYCIASDDCRNKVVAAREDAAYFVASEGEVKTAALDEALAAIREVQPALDLSDIELAVLMLQ